MLTSVTETSWFVLNVKPGLLKKVIDFLNKKNLEHYCPFLSIHRKSDDRRRNAQQSLFPSYIFVKEKAIKQEVLTKMQGGVNLVYWLGEPATIEDEEVTAIKTFLQTHQQVTFEKCAINNSEGVKIVQGSAIKREGNIVHVRSMVTKMQLPSIGYNLISQAANKQDAMGFEKPVAENASDFYDFRIKNSISR